MVMNFIITESQLKLILEGRTSPRFSEYVRKMYSFTNKLISKVQKKYKLNLSLLTTWGTAVGGLVMPLDNYIKTNNLSLDDNQTALILIGIASAYFLDNKKLFGKIIEKIKEEGIYEIFKNVISKSEDLKFTFTSFIKSLNTTLESVTDILSYAFLIPIVMDLQQLAQKNSDLLETSEIVAERLMVSGIVVVSGVALVNLINKMLDRLSKDN